ncbi:TPA: type II toxin-antitoxin system MqsA family antitoxin [Photobacterium damselae]
MCKCKICNSDRVLEFSDSEIIKYKGNDLSVIVDYSECAECGREFITKDQILVNELRIREAKKKYDGLLSKDEIVIARKELNITQEEASRIFGGGRNAFSKYERGEVSQSVSMDKLIRICLEDRATFNKLAKESGVAVSSVEPSWNNVFYYNDYKTTKKSSARSSSCVSLLNGEVSYCG